MGRGTAERDDAFIEEEWEQLMAGGAEAEAAGDLAGARDRYRQVAAAFAGLRDTGAARAAAERLEASSAFKKQLRQRRRWDAVDDRYSREKVPLLREAGNREARASAEELRRLLEIRSLKKAAEGDGYEAVAAKRRLHRVFTQASFYLPRSWMEEGDYRAAHTVLSVALEVRDDLPWVWCNLACTAARLRRPREAMAALESAVERGFADAALLRDDADLASLRGREEFGRLLERLESAPPQS